MKKMKLAAIFAGLVSVFTFSSCLNDGDSGSNYDLYEIVTVEEGSIFGGTVLKGDAWGYTYTPVASSGSVVTMILIPSSSKIPVTRSLTGSVPSFIA